MSLLLLGGTHEGRLLAQHLHQLGIPVIYSLAGLARTPDLPCRIIHGGFGQYGGLSRYISKHGISAILDATHPFASNISATACLAAVANNIPYWQWQRDEWIPQPTDNWVEFDNWDCLMSQLSHYQSVFFTLGRIPDPIIRYCLYTPTTRFTIRSASAMDQATMERLNTAGHINMVQAFGPFSLTSEYEIIKQHGVDALVCKNSGGEATSAKLNVARHLGLPVFMLKRPPLPLADKSFCNIDLCGEYIKTMFNTLSGADNAF